MRNIAFLIMTSIFVYTSSYGQQFVNGSFEPTGTISKCKYDSISKFNKNMGGIWASGSADTGLYLADNSCGIGNPVNGTYFLRSRYHPMEGSNYIFLKLTAPMQKNVRYKFSFSMKGPVTGDALIPTIGFSNDSINHTYFAHGLPVPIGSSWQLVNDSITPTIEAKYIWIAGSHSTASSEGHIYLDNFVMYTPASVAETNIDASIDIYPNPVTDESHITFDNGITYPIVLTIYDITGKMVFRDKVSSKKDVIISKTQLREGVNILKITDAENRNCYKKLVSD